MTGSAWLDDEAEARIELDRLALQLQEARAQQDAAGRRVAGLSLMLDGIGDLHPTLREHLPELTLPPTSKRMRRVAKASSR